MGFFVLFIITTLSIGIVQRDSGGSSIMSGIEPDASQADATIEVEADSVPASVEDEATEDGESTADTTPEPSLPDDSD